MSVVTQLWAPFLLALIFRTPVCSPLLSYLCFLCVFIASSILALVGWMHASAPVHMSSRKEETWLWKVPRVVDRSVIVTERDCQHLAFSVWLFHNEKHFLAFLFHARRLIRFGAWVYTSHAYFSPPSSYLFDIVVEYNARLSGFGLGGHPSLATRNAQLKKASREIQRKFNDLFYKADVL